MKVAASWIEEEPVMTRSDCPSRLAVVANLVGLLTSVGIVVTLVALATLRLG